MQSYNTKKGPSAFFARDPNPLFHLIEILGEGSAARGGQAILGTRDTSLEELHAGNVLRLFELAGVNAEIAVGGLEHALEIVEAQRIVGGEGADNAEADALVNEAVELGEFGSHKVRVGVVLSFFVRLVLKSLARAKLRLERLAAGWKRSSHHASSQ